MSSGSHPHHGIDYIEIPALDLEEAKRFYGESFGWRFNDYGPAYVGFVDGARGAQEAGGFRKEAEIHRGGPLVILHSRDLEGTFERVRSAGGAITKPIFEFPGGRRFQFTDPSGNELGVWCDE